MTPLPAFDEQVVERNDLPEYEIPSRCCNPRCPNRAEHPREIRPRSQTAGMVWWVELVGRYLIGNRVGVCAGCHSRTDDHTAAIIWDERASTLVWIDLTDEWAEPLDPMPPIHKTGEAQIHLQVETPPGGEPFVSEQIVSDQDRKLMAQDQAIHGVSFEKEGRRIDPADVTPVNELTRPLQNLDAFLEAIQQTDDEPPVENADFTVVPPEPDLLPNEPLQSEPEPEPELVGDDQATVDRAKLATEEASRQARELENSLAAPASPWRADVVVYPDEQRVEVLHGDLRVGTFLEETIAKARRAPKPREPRPKIEPPCVVCGHTAEIHEKVELGERRPCSFDDMGGPDHLPCECFNYEPKREPTKAKRTWSIAVPLDERDGDRVAAGEDGYTLIEDGLDLAREKLGRDDHPGWKYFVLVDLINWFNLNYTDEGEN